MERVGSLETAASKAMFTKRIPTQADLKGTLALAMEHMRQRIMKLGAR